MPSSRMQWLCFAGVGGDSGCEERARAAGGAQLCGGAARLLQHAEEHGLLPLARLLPPVHDARRRCALLQLYWLSSNGCTLQLASCLMPFAAQHVPFKMQVDAHFET